MTDTAERIAIARREIRVCEMRIKTLAADAPLRFKVAAWGRLREWQAMLADAEAAA